jgi:phosphatidylinositol alpha-1,6-mannosyltransferase
MFTGSFPPGAGGSIEYIVNIFSKLPAGSATVNTGSADHPQAAAFDAEFPQKVVRKAFIVNVLDGEKYGRARKFLGRLRWVASAFSMIARTRPDVVHIGEYNYTFLAALLARVLFKTPYIIYTYAEEITYLTTRPSRLRLFQMAIAHAAAIITVCDYTKNVLIECGADASKIHKILPSVGDSKRTLLAPAQIESVRQKYKLSGRRVLLTVGRLEERKGHLSVIDAMPEILRKFPATVYVVVGIGPFRDRIKMQVERAGLGNSVIFAGRAPDEDVAALYEVCDIFVMPHRELALSHDTEGCPTVFLEAGAHGKPVIGGNAGGVADAIVDGQTGYIVDGTDAAQIALKVVTLLGDGNLSRSMGAAGREYVALLTPGISAAAIERINEAVIARNA